MAQRDLYEVLGVSRDATQEDIKKAFRRIAREYHPDVNPDPEAERRFKEANLAYETLSDPAKRQQYDRFGGEGFSPDMFSFGDLGDIFEAFFGSSPFTRQTGQRQSRGRDLRVLLDLTFEEAAFGVQKEIEVTSLERCERCDGSGAEPGTSPERCSTCGGSGQVSDVRRSVFGTVMTARTCGTCEGRGEEIKQPCTECRGEGRTPKPHRVTIEVPAGVAHGLELRIEGAGEDGRRGAPPGDLYVGLSVEEHPLYERHGQDLLGVLEVPVTAAMLGADVDVETLEGVERVRVEPGTHPGALLRLRGKGVPNLGRRGRGDLLLRVDVEIPPKLRGKERTLVEELAQRRGERGPLRGRVRRPPSA